MILWSVLGWAGNASFFSRSFVQWLASERAKSTRTPLVFWHLSLAGTLLLGLYSAHRAEWILLVGYVVNGLLYARNLRLASSSGGRRIALSAALPLAVLAAVLLLATQARPAAAPDQAPGWILCAAVGQSLWSTRFLVQWVLSEREGRSHLPPSFWWLSLAGNGPLLAYAIHLGDPIFVAAYVPGPIVQVRNLMLASRARGARPGAERGRPSPRAPREGAPSAAPAHALRRR